MPPPKMTEKEQKGYEEALRKIEEWRRKGKGGTMLNLGGFGLTALPPEIGQLTALTGLSLSGNRLAALPPEIGQLTALTALYLQGNQLTELPPELGQLTALTSLSLYSNRLAELPPELGQLTALTSLSLSLNHLTALPPEIGQLTALTALHLFGNPIPELPLELGHCGDELVIDGLASLPLTFPPMDVASLGTGAVLRYLRAVEAGEETVWESKVLLVGEGAVGKTRLYRALRGAAWVEGAPDPGATVGIEIGALDFPHPALAEVTMRLKCWDFAGQDVTHATHQFFFSERTLFVVCWNARAGWEAGKLRKWLANIRDRAPHATVLLVAAQCDEPHSDYPETELRADFPQIAATFKTSSKTGEGLAALGEAIAQHARTLPMMGLRWPQSWRAAQQAVAALRAHEPYAGLPQVVRELRRHGLEAEDAEVLLRWLHELGEVLHYHDDPELADTVMLDPQWVTKRVGEVLASHEVQEAKGVLTRACLAALWPETEQAIRDHLLRMMERFDLAYRVPDHEADRSLVVERLPQNPPAYEEGWRAWAGQPEVRLRYRLKAMHPGIPTWFIARCHRFSCGVHWLRGVLFQDHAVEPRHLALIVANESERTVDFTVRGAQPWTFLPLLKDGFEDTVTKRYPGLEFDCFVPCPGKHPDGKACTYAFKIDILERRLAPSDPGAKPKETVECLDCGTEHQISMLLLGLSRLPARDEVLFERIKRELETQFAGQSKELQEGFADLRKARQLDFVHEWNAAQEIEEQSCPTVFALFPVDGATITRTSTMRLQLYCMAPGCWHGIGADGACQFQPLKEGWATAARWTHHAIKWLRPAAALLPAVGALAGEASAALQDAAEAARNELALTAAVFRELEKIPALTEASDAGIAHGALPREHRGAVGLRELKTFLDSLDFPKPCGGLVRRRTPEGHILWLCPEHAREAAGRR